MAATPDQTSSAPATAPASAPTAGRPEPREAAFRRIVGRLPDEAARARFDAIRSELRLRDDDALWALFVALEHYYSLYERFPPMIRAAAGELLVDYKTETDRVLDAAEQRLWNAGREQANAALLEVTRAGAEAAEAAEARLERAIRQAARRIALEAGLAARWPWVFGGAVGMALVLLLTGAVALGFGRQQGYHQGFVEGQRAAVAAAPGRPPDRPPSPPARGR
jgi:hypothetical protein